MGRQKKPGPQFVYQTLNDAAICVNQKVNFYGVVTEFEQGKKTQGPDIICTMTVEDMSYGEPGLRVIVFSPKSEKVPVLKSLGDIIRFHRATINVFNNQPQAVVKVKHGGSFLIFDGTEGSGDTPYQVSSNTFTMEDHDRNVLDKIRSWSRKLPLNRGVNGYLVHISGIKEGNYFDLCCKILVVDHRESPHTVTVYVWDGTDAPPPHIHVPEGHAQKFPSVEILSPLTREMISTFPPIGTALPVVCERPLEDLELQALKPGRWIKLRNIICRVREGMYEAVYMSGSKTCLLSSNFEVVRKCERMFERRVSDVDDERLPQHCPKPLQSMTVTEHEHVPFSTLRETLKHPQVTFKFRCLVRVLSILPTTLEEFCVLNSSLESNEMTSSTPKRQANVASAYVYRLRLTLEDATGRMYAYLCGEDAEHFFNGIPAANFQSHGTAFNTLSRKVQKLLGFEEYRPYEGGNPEIRYDPPWIKCCLKSYYLDRESPWDTRRYKIFGTKLL